MMSDEQIDLVIAAAVPELKVALRGVLKGETVHIFNLADGRNLSTGIETKVVCFVATEAPAAVLEATARGLDKASEISVRAFKALASKWGKGATP